MEPFVPHKLPLENIDWTRHIRKISSANRALATYAGILQSMINPAILLSPLVSNEAVLSSKIEGTQATLQEVLEFEASPNKPNPKYDDIQEIINYRTSMAYAVNWLETRPANLNMLKQVHQILLDSVRGQNKNKGFFRKIQNWIGKPGCSMKEATYIPPNPEILMDCLTNFENYYHFDEKDKLVQLAIIHAQFEIIHPFLDGNGRIGRMLIPLFLFEHKLIDRPMFYISQYFENHREEYYSKLNHITLNHDWNSWINFFLDAVTHQADDNSKKAKDILNLYEEKKQEISELTRSHFIYNLVDTLFKMPIFNTTDFAETSDIPHSSLKRLLKILTDNEIITILEQGKGANPTVYLFSKLFEIVK